MRRLTVVTIAAALTAGCGSDASDSEAGAFASVVSDSAGVELHTFDGTPAFDTLVELRRLGIAGFEEPVGSVGPARILGPETVAFADSQADHVWIVGSDGTQLLGRRGEGPSEFERVASFRPIPGTGLLRFYDSTGPKLQDFRQDDQSFVTAWPLVETSGVRPQSAAAIDEGRSVLGMQFSASLPGSGLSRSSAVVAWIDHTTGELHRLDTIPSQEFLVHDAGGGRIMLATPLFGRDAWIDAVGGMIVQAVNDDYDLALREPDSGDIVRRIRRTGQERLATDARLQHELAQRLDVLDPQYHAGAEEFFWDSQIHDSIPAFTELIVDPSSDAIWLREPTPTGDPDRWIGFGVAGDFRGAFVAPPEVEILDVHGTTVLGMVTDELGLEDLVVFSFR